MQRKYGKMDFLHDGWIWCIMNHNYYWTSLYQKGYKAQNSFWNAESLFIHKFMLSILHFTLIKSIGITYTSIPMQVFSLWVSVATLRYFSVLRDIHIIYYIYFRHQKCRICGKKCSWLSSGQYSHEGKFVKYNYASRKVVTLAHSVFIVG